MRCALRRRETPELDSHNSRLNRGAHIDDFWLRQAVHDIAGLGHTPFRPVLQLSNRDRICFDGNRLVEFQRRSPLRSGNVNCVQQYQAKKFQVREERRSPPEEYSRNTAGIASGKLCPDPASECPQQEKGSCWRPTWVVAQCSCAPACCNHRRRLTSRSCHPRISSSRLSFQLNNS